MLQILPLLLSAPQSCKSRSSYRTQHPWVNLALSSVEEILDLGTNPTIYQKLFTDRVSLLELNPQSLAVLGNPALRSCLRLALSQVSLLGMCREEWLGQGTELMSAAAAAAWLCPQSDLRQSWGASRTPNLSPAAPAMLSLDRPKVQLLSMGLHSSQAGPFGGFVRSWCWQDDLWHQS